MEQEELPKFIEWLRSTVDEFEGKSAEEVVAALNNAAQTENGMAMISDLISKFKSSKTGMFRNGGKVFLRTFTPLPHFSKYSKFNK